MVTLRFLPAPRSFCCTRQRNYLPTRGKTITLSSTTSGEAAIAQSGSRLDCRSGYFLPQTTAPSSHRDNEALLSLPKRKSVLHQGRVARGPSPVESLYSAFQLCVQARAAVDIVSRDCFFTPALLDRICALVGHYERKRKPAPIGCFQSNGGPCAGQAVEISISS